MDDDALEQQIRQRAYELWELDPAPKVNPDDYWYEARKQVEAEGGTGPVEVPVPQDQSGKRRREGELLQEDASEEERIRR